jgi:hypothetical protein
MIDLGQFDAELSVTLWYTGSLNSSSVPVVAELSFRYQDSSADYSQKVVNRAAQSFAALQTLSSWLDNNAQTKTQFVYGYQSNFCN